MTTPPTEQDFLRITREEFITLLLEIQQTGKGGESWQERVDWMIEQARIRRATQPTETAS